MQQGHRAPCLPSPHSLHPGWQHPVTNSSRLDFSKGRPALNLADSALCGSSHPCQLESSQKPIIISPPKAQLEYSPPPFLQAGLLCAFPQTQIPLVGSITALSLHALFHELPPAPHGHPAGAAALPQVAGEVTLLRPVGRLWAAWGLVPVGIVLIGAIWDAPWPCTPRSCLEQS